MLINVVIECQGLSLSQFYSPIITERRFTKLYLRRKVICVRVDTVGLIREGGQRDRPNNTTSVYSAVVNVMAIEVAIYLTNGHYYM